MGIYWDEVHRPDEREIRLLSALARQAAMAMDNARLVSDLRRTLDDLKAAQETLVRGATLRAVGELAAGAAHHLNNLMAVVLGRTQLLLMKKPPEDLVASLKTIERVGAGRGGDGPPHPGLRAHRQGRRRGRASTSTR